MQKSLFTRIGEAIDQHRQEHQVQAVQSDDRTRPSRLPRLVGWFLPNGGTLLLIAILIFTQNVWAGPMLRNLAAESAASTGTIAYQGRLADSSGNPLTSTLNMSFRLYSAASGGAPLWSEQWTGSNGVKVSDGLFNVMLGSLTPIPQSVITSNAALFLGITVGTDDEMTPRVQLGSVPFAVQALTVPDGSVTTAKIADGAVTKAKLSGDTRLNSITTSKLTGPSAEISTNLSNMVSDSITVTSPSDVLITVTIRAVYTTDGDEFGFYVYRDGTDLNSTAHSQAAMSGGHLYFNFTFLDTQVVPGTYTYSLKGVLIRGSGTRPAHSPTIALIVIPRQ